MTIEEAVEAFLVEHSSMFEDGWERPGELAERIERYGAAMRPDCPFANCASCRMLKEVAVAAFIGGDG